MPTVRRAGHTIHYDTRGEGPPLLLVMGLGLSGRYWSRWIDLLSPSFRVITLDNRGTGRSSAPRAPFRVADMADDAAAVLADAGAPRAQVFGVSMGGMIAQELALRHPARVGSLVLAATTPGGLRAYVDMLSVAQVLARSFFLSPAESGRLLVPYLTPSRDLSFFQEWVAIGRSEPRPPARGPLLQLLACGMFSSAARLRRVEAPALVLAGDQDKIIPCAHSERLAALLPRAEFHVLKDTGHVFLIEREGEVLAHLRRFFAAHPL